MINIKLSQYTPFGLQNNRSLCHSKLLYENYLGHHNSILKLILLITTPNRCLWWVYWSNLVILGVCPVFPTLLFPAVSSYSCCKYFLQRIIHYLVVHPPPFQPFLPAVSQCQLLQMYCSSNHCLWTPCKSFIKVNFEASFARVSLFWNKLNGECWKI